MPVGQPPAGEAAPLSVTAKVPAPMAPVAQPPAKTNSKARPAARPSSETASGENPIVRPKPLPQPSPAVGTDEKKPRRVAAVPYTVQVLATRDGREAEALARNLKKRGVGAFVTAVEGETGRWYRVRIGRYDDLRAAQRMADRCRRELGLTQAYVSAYRTEP